MDVRIVAFGIARDIVGGNYVDMTIDDQLTVKDTIEILKLKFPSFKQLASISLAVNEAYVDPDYKLCEGDEIVIIPPVSGG